MNDINTNKEHSVEENVGKDLPKDEMVSSDKDLKEKKSVADKSTERFKSQSVDVINDIIEEIRSWKTDKRVTEENVDDVAVSLREVLDAVKSIYQSLDKVESYDNKKLKAKINKLLDKVIKNVPNESTFNYVDKSLRKEITNSKKFILSKNKEEGGFEF